MFCFPRRWVSGRAQKTVTPCSFILTVPRRYCPGSLCFVLYFYGLCCVGFGSVVFWEGWDFVYDLIVKEYFVFSFLGCIKGTYSPFTQRTRNSEWQEPPLSRSWKLTLTENPSVSSYSIRDQKYFQCEGEQLSRQLTEVYSRCIPRIFLHRWNLYNHATIPDGTTFNPTVSKQWFLLQF